MDTSLYVNLSNQVALSRQLELVANNLANMNTTGFRAERMLFDQALKNAGASDSISFVIDRASYTDHSAGAKIVTGGQYDVAIVGEGWFAVETPDGVRYTRDGRFVVSPAGELTALDGARVLDEGGAPIPIPGPGSPPDELNLAIADDGSISAGELQIGRLAVYRFENEQTLVRQGDGRFEAPAQPQILDGARVEQGAIEGSNVNPVTEVTRLIELSRAYEQAARMASDVNDQKKDAIKRLGGQA